MQRFKNILLVYDGSESRQTTFARAIDLATRNQARLTVIQVINQIPRDYRMLIAALPVEEIMKAAVKEHTLVLEKYMEPFSKDVNLRAMVVVGQEFIEIIKEVLRNDHDLVIKTARGMSGTTDMLFGSTAMHLLRKCPCPVWMIKPGQDQGYGRIMAAVDVVPMESEENDLNNKIMEMATSLTSHEKSELHIVHVWEKPDANLWTGWLKYLPGDIDTLIHETKEMHSRWLDTFLGQYDLHHLQHCKHVLHGWAEEEIPGFAEQHQIDLIVMGTVSRSGIPGFWIGNTTEKILPKINCSVLAVKPEGFLSPIRLDDKL